MGCFALKILVNFLVKIVIKIHASNLINVQDLFIFPPEKALKSENVNKNYLFSITILPIFYLFL